MPVFLLFLQIIHVESKNSASSSNYPSGRKRFRRSKRCKGKSPLHGVPEKKIKDLKNRILFVISFRQNATIYFCDFCHNFDFLILNFFLNFFPKNERNFIYY